ncbi:metal-dependent hydrolase [Faucicola mancuniensis]|uniref:metal-dependent hydrolase n=1 Tax=Faucicola mancuniensis TaxID=1309795 RepID=UPI0039776C27
MANFNTHLSTAFIMSTTASLVVYKAGMVTSIEFFLCAIVGTIGGLLPDIDLENSIPTRIGFNIIALLVAFGAVVFWIAELSVVELLVVWASVYAMMRWGVLMLFSSLTVHRGIVHSIPFMLLLSLILVYASYYGVKNGAVFSWFLGLFLFFGTMVHLILDEMYSVNIFGLKIKKSFGTAIKFFDKNQKKSYFALYSAVVLLLMFAPPYKVFWQNLTNPITWQILKQNFMPNYLSNLLS